MKGRESMTLASFEQFRTEAGAAPSAEAAAAATRLIAHVTIDALPAPAQGHWRDATRLMKVPADKPISEKAVESIRSWPAARVAELRGHVEKIHAVLEKAENDRLEDEIRDNIRRHYL